MTRKMFFSAILLVAVLFCCACEKNGGTENATPTQEGTPTVAAEPTATPTPTVSVPRADTPTPTVSVPRADTPTPTVGARWMCQECGRANDGDVCTNCGAPGPERPTPTPDPSSLPVYGSPDQIASNRELQAILHPKKELLPLGTMPSMGEIGQMVREYGIEWKNYYEESTVYKEKIEPRLRELENAMADPDYLPSVAGILAIIREKGLPSEEVYGGVRYCANGIVSCCVTGNWEWYESKQFASDEEAMAFLNSPWIPDPKASLTWNAENYEENFYSITYRLVDEVGVTFNLVTGEELALADLFPEGFDYISYLNGKIAEQMRYLYWFDSYEYNESGEVVGIWGGRSGDAYRETAEYDGAAVFAGFTGEETFYIDYNGRLVFPGLWNGGPIEVDLPEPVWYFSGEQNPSGSEGSYTCEPIYTVDLTQYDTNGALREVSVGKVRLSRNGRQSDVTVWRGSNPEEEGRGTALPERKESFAKLFTDEVLLNIANQWIEKQWVQESEQYGEDYTPQDITFIRGSVFPNGYTCFLLQHTGDEDVGWGEQVSSFWVKDGKIIPWEDLFDISAEELMFLLLSNLRMSANGPEVLSREKCAAAAKVIAKYASLTEISRFESMYGWRMENYPYGLGFDYRLVDRENESIPAEERAQIPPVLYGRSFDLCDPNLLLRHLRMYQGFPFE